MTGAIILAAGNGSRFGGYKQFEKVNGKQIIDYTIDIYKDVVDNLIVVIPAHYNCGLQTYTVGGKTRFESMINGFNAFDCSHDKMLIVDGVCCNTPKRIIDDLLEKLDEYDAASPVLPAMYTMGYELDDGFKPVKKDKMYCIQTPTAFRWEVLEEIVYKYDGKNSGFSFVYSAYHDTKANIDLVKGDSTNIKITYPGDLRLFKALRGEEGCRKHLKNV